MHRVLFPFVGDAVGGSHISACLLIRELARHNVKPITVVHEIGALGEYFDKQAIAYEQAPLVDLVEPGSIGKEAWRMARAAVPLAGYLKGQQIDIVHTNDYRMHLSWGPAARLAGARLVWHQRTPNDSRRLGFYVRLAHRVLSISDYCRRGLPPSMAASATVIANPFTTELSDRAVYCAAAELRERLGVPEGGAVVGFVSNLMQRKRPNIFVEAAALIRRHAERSVRFAMFGESRPPLGDMIRQQIERLGLTEVCIHMGPRHPIEPWLAGCDLLLAPAVNEGFGRTLVEAMLAGTPVIAAASGGHNEIIEDGVTGVLVPADDPGALADAAAELLADPARAKALARKAQQLALDKYSAKRHAEAIQQVYQELIP